MEDSIQAFANALDRAYRSIRLYPAGHPTQSQVVEAATQTIRAALATGEVAFEVHPSKLLSCGEVVLEAPAGRDSLIYPLARDGIVYLEFRAELTPAVLLDFLSLCARAGAAEEDDGLDLGALLWARDLPGIAFTLNDQLLDGGEEEASPGTLDTAELPIGTGWAAEDVDLPDDLASDLGLTGQSDTEADSAAMAALGYEDRTNSPDTELVYALLGALSAEEQEEDRQVLSRALTEHLEETSGRGDARPLRYAFDLAGDLSPSTRGRVLPALSTLAIWAPLMSQLRTASVPGGPTLLDHLAGLGPAGVTLVCQILGDAPDRTLRRHLCDWLVAAGPEALPRITPFAADSRWYLVRNVAYVLGEMGVPSTADALERVASHADSRVRRQAIRSLAKAAPQRVVGVARRALLDPNLDVRVTAIQALDRVGGPGATELLARHLDDPPDNEEEAGEAYRALAGLDQETARKLLLERLQARGRKSQAMVRGVVRGLRLIRAPWANELLAVGARSPGEVGALCRAVQREAR